MHVKIVLPAQYLLWKPSLFIYALSMLCFKKINILHMPDIQYVKNLDLNLLNYYCEQTHYQASDTCDSRESNNLRSSAGSVFFFFSAEDVTNS